MKLKYWILTAGLFAVLCMGGCAHRTIQPVAIDPSLPPVAQKHILTDEIQQVLGSNVVYPRRALLNGEMGRTVISFDYLDGRLSNVAVMKSSGYNDLDYAAVEAAKRAQQIQIPPPPAFKGKLLHLHVPIGFGLGNQ